MKRPVSGIWIKAQWAGTMATLTITRQEILLAPALKNINRIIYMVGLCVVLAFFYICCLKLLMWIYFLEKVDLVQKW